MSLTAALLFGAPIELPAGRPHTYFLFDYERATRDPRKPSRFGMDRAAMKAWRAENTENVFKAICSGLTRVDQLCEATGLSSSTIMQGAKDLIAAGRVRKVRDWRVCHYYPAEEQQ